MFSGAVDTDTNRKKFISKCFFHSLSSYLSRTCYALNVTHKNRTEIQTHVNSFPAVIMLVYCRYGVKHNPINPLPVDIALPESQPSVIYAAVDSSNRRPAGGVGQNDVMYGNLLRCEDQEGVRNPERQQVHPGTENLTEEYSGRADSY